MYPFPAYDYLRTRLTHTIEVAYAGRVIATAAATRLASLHRDGINPQDCGDIVYAACLAHDLGNPPFGHIGEYAIRTWFQERKGKGEFSSVFSNPELGNDFLCFDGNAQGFRIMTRLASWRNLGGMQLTYPVLGAFSKYPRSSKALEPDKPKAKLKFGYTHSDRDAAEIMYAKLGMRESGRTFRHPLAYIVEAADDISYLTADVDDAHRMDLLSTKRAEELLLPIANLGGTASRYETISKTEDRDRISYLRSVAANALVNEVIRIFCDQEDTIRAGGFSGSLLDKARQARHVEEIRTECERTVFTERSKLQIEAAGYNVIRGLMDLYGGMINELLEKKGVDEINMRNRSLYALLPEEFRSRLAQHSNAYECLMVLVDYVSGMTDRYALDLFQRLMGTSVALGRMA